MHGFYWNEIINILQADFHFYSQIFGFKCSIYARVYVAFYSIFYYIFLLSLFSTKVFYSFLSSFTSPPSLNTTHTYFHFPLLLPPATAIHRYTPTNTYHHHSQDFFSPFFYSSISLLLIRPAKKGIFCVHSTPPISLLFNCSTQRNNPTHFLL